MSPVRRLVVAAGAGLLALVTVAPPAWASEHPPQVMLTSPVVFQEQGRITGTITADEGEDQTLTEVEYTLVPDPEIYESNDQADPCFVDLPANDKVQTFADDRTEASFNFDVPFTCNRAYQLTVDVSYEDRGLLPIPRPGTTAATLDFSVAIKPTKVKGLAANYDAGTREVLLTWAPNPEPDTQYRVERTPPGEPRFAGIGGPVTGTEFRDPDIGDPQIYRVVALRPEPPSGQFDGEPSDLVLSGPAPPDLDPPAPAPDGSGPSGNGNASSGGGSRPPSRTRTTADTGFDEALPFDPSQTTTIPPDTTPASEPSGDAAVLAEFDDGVSDEEQQRATLVPVAGGLALIVGALHLFLLSKRAGESDIPIVPR